MKLLDVLHAPWAITPDKLLEIQAIYATHLRGEKIDVAAVEQRIGRPLANEPKSYEIIDGVAILPIEGVIAKRANLFMQISGGVSSEMVARSLREALADTSVHSIILSIDSPGGTVDGTQLLANIIVAGRDAKPIVTFASGMMGSAAYWIGSAAQAIYIADDTTEVGSIGVVATHVDVSKAEEARGVKTTEVYAGKFKRISSQYAPLSDDGRKTIQERVDYTYSLFVQAVAHNRGVAEEKVLSDMADGRVFMGKQAIEAGLVDGVSTLDALVSKLNVDRQAGTTKPRAGAAHKPTPPKGNSMSLTKDQVAADHPDIAKAFMADGATAERARIQAVEGQSMAGHEAIINTMKFDGKSTAGDAALAVLAAEKSVLSSRAAALAKDAPDPLKQAPAKPGDDKPATFGAVGQVPKDQASATALDAKAKEYQGSHPGTSYIAAIKAVQKGA